MRHRSLHVALNSSSVMPSYQWCLKHWAGYEVESRPSMTPSYYLAGRLETVKDQE
uniref:Uncharacterized protein n=1 Tax=Arion vulgaris TaxID=1028688 RepID=A0A0B6XY72_9EUPU